MQRFKHFKINILSFGKLFNYQQNDILNIIRKIRKCICKPIKRDCEQVDGDGTYFNLIIDMSLEHLF